MLVIGIGNIGRADDGLGWAFLDRLKNEELFDTHYRYQLQIEDAELISNCDEVWFVDASNETYEAGFQIMDVEPETKYTYTSHELHPSAVLQLCKDIYGVTPKARLIAIAGKDWGIRTGMSEVAKERLTRAVNAFLETNCVLSA